MPTEDVPSLPPAAPPADTSWRVRAFERFFWLGFVTGVIVSSVGWVTLFLIT